MPEEILEASRKHSGRSILWQAESELCGSILEDGELTATMESALPEMLWFFVTSSWDVFSNIGTLEEWWKLGNLRVDSVSTVMRRFEQDRVLGLQTLLHYPANELVEEYGDPDSRKIYSAPSDLLSLYHARRCERIWKGNGHSV